jgi:hypothetical protein
VYRRYRKAIGKGKHIENNFYAEGSLNNNLESEI